MEAPDLTAWLSEPRVESARPDFGPCVSRTAAAPLIPTAEAASMITGKDGKGGQTVLAAAETNQAVEWGTTLYSSGISCAGTSGGTHRTIDQGTVELDNGSASWFLLARRGGGYSAHLVVRKQRRVTLLWLDARARPDLAQLEAMDRLLNERLA
ncbi:hypothetical protein CGZ93_00385 [Enemella dayhoffiae]|uniref:Uncharacterized protein n=1 Tax=Enemella dayhoffiae TaxID=2016507 RepID=A0A255HBI1_9ACTN|nr:hypothetical protein CGZ93_00385 [Enemella dayhoffiae]